MKKIIKNLVHVLVVILLCQSFGYAQNYSSQQINFKASWEKYPENAPWTEYLYNLIDLQLFDHLDKAKDMKRFCPTYAKLDREHKIYVWIELFSQVSYYESAWDPTSRMEENMGTDPVTGKSVFSEGLLQLSYQDVVNYPKLLKFPDCKFDWSKDKKLKATDPRKTILDPYINLECGSRIMGDQIDHRGKIVLSSSVYWATLKEGGWYSVVPEIITTMKKIPFCR